MFDLNVRWTTTLQGPPTCSPVSIQDLTVVRQRTSLQAFDDSGRLVWTREVAPGQQAGELAASDDVIATSHSVDITDEAGKTVGSTTCFEFYDEGAQFLRSATANGTMRQGGLVVRGKAVHAWMNDGGLAFRRMHLDEQSAVHEVLMPPAQPWDDSVTKLGVVLVGFCGRREGALLWNPRTQTMDSLIENTDVWSHGIAGDTAVFAVGMDEEETTLVAVDLTTQEEIWRRSDTTRGIAVTEQGVLVYLGNQDRLPALLDLHTGDILWMATNTHAGFSWDVSGPIALARGRDTVAYDLVTGRHLGEVEMGAVLPFEDHFVAVIDEQLVAFDYPETLADDSQPIIVVPIRGVRPSSIGMPGWQENWERPLRRA